MIQTASPWVLAEGATHRREPARPLHRRPADFAAQFDACTIFYDCFRLNATQVMLPGPPLNQFAGVLDSLHITSMPSGNVCRFAVEHKFTASFANPRKHTLCRVIVEVPESDASLQMHSNAGNAVLEIRPLAADLFRGKRVLLTLSRNNDPAWICDWMRFHRDLQNADAVLLYDNGSTAYKVDSLLAAMKQVSGFSAIAVVAWPFKYGPQGIGRGTWDSSFCQDGALEDARWRFLAQAYAVLSCDVDELALAEYPDLFDRASASPTGYVKFSGRWVNAFAPQTPPRHRDSTLQLKPRWRWKGFRLKDVHRCPAKWAAVPGRCPHAAQWTVHEIVGMRTRTLPVAEALYRHFRQIGTNWKNNRAGILPADRALHREDAKLREAFAKVDWEV